MHLQKRILVTGGSGFLGSHLCERLLAQDANVICVDNFYTGTRKNVEHLLAHPSFELVRHDVTFPLYIEVDQMRLMATEDAVTGPMNIGNPAEFSIHELATQVIELTGSKTLLRIIPCRRTTSSATATRYHTRAGSARLGAEDRAQGRNLAKTIAYFDEILSDKGTRDLLSGAASD